MGSLFARASFLGTILHAQFSVGAYIIHERLGQGAMGEVYRATRRLTREMVAIKRVSQDPEASGPESSVVASGKVALISEFQTLASLHHPNIVQVLDYGFDNLGYPFVVMELLQGAQELSDAAKGRDNETVVRYIGQLLQALIYLHRRGLLHRDLKPSNVLVTNGVVKLIDFGVAMETSESAILDGTLAYMAPEVLQGHGASVATDLYAVGLIAYQLLVGKLPFDTSSTEALVQSILGIHRNGVTSGSAVLDVSGPLAPFMTRLLQRDPQKRYADARQALTDLALHSRLQLVSESQQTRESFLQSAPLAGRVSELTTLRDALQDAAEGVPNFWLLGGESGVGKSRIVSELRTIALVRRTLVAEGQAPSEGGSAYALWRPLLSQLCVQTDVDWETASTLMSLVPDIAFLIDKEVAAAPALEGDGAKTRLFAAVEKLIRGSKSPLLLVLEDFHWAGPESIDLLHHLLASLNNVPVTLLATYRDDERPKLPEELPSMRVMKIARLNNDETSSLVRSMLGMRGEDPDLVKFLLSETEGNAFFMVEVLRALAEQSGELESVTAGRKKTVLTGGMKRIIECRLDAVIPADRQLVRLAAVAGRQLDMGLLAALEPQADLLAWQVRCANAAVLDVADGRWRFAHDKLREATLRDISSGDRVTLEERVAEAIEALHGRDDGYVADLALHWSRANQPDKAATYYVKAGEVAERTAAPAAAREAYAAGLRELDRMEESLPVVRRLADYVVTYALCAWTAEPADAILPRFHDALWRLQRWAGAAPEVEDRRREGMLQLWTGRLELTRGNTAKGLEHYRWALKIGEEIHDTALISSPSIMIGQALAVRGYWGNWEMLVRGFDWVQQNASFIEYGRVAGYIGSGLAAAGRLQDGLAYVDPPCKTAKETGNPRAIAFMRIYHALMYTHAVKLDEARQAATEAVENARLTGDRLLEFIGLGMCVWSFGRSGMLDEALDAMRAERAVRGALGSKLLLGDWVEAAEAELLYASGQMQQAQRFTESLAAESAKLDRLFSGGIAQRILAQLVNKRGVRALEETRSHLSESLRQFALAGMTMEAARTHLAWARIAQEHGLQVEAQEHYGAHVDAYRKAGVVPEPLEQTVVA